MTKSTCGRAKKLSRHLLRTTLKMTTKKWILGTGTIALLYLGGTALPLSSTSAQDAQSPVPALVAGPVRIKGATRSTSGDVVAPGERVELQVINISDEAINVGMEIRDAADFSRILASSERTLLPREYFLLPYIEQDNLFRSVVSNVAPVSNRGNDSSPSGWNRPAVLATLSVVDDSTNMTKFVLGTHIVAIRIQGPAIR